MAKDRGLDEEEEEDEGGEELMDDFDTPADQLCPTEVVLVVKGRRIGWRGSSLFSQFNQF